MERPMSWNKAFQHHTGEAIELVMDCVAVLRARGVKTPDALRDLSDIMRTSPRRMRTLFHRDGSPVVLKHEWMSLRYRAGLFFLNESVRLHALANKYEERGNELVSGQQEFQWE